MNGIPGNARRLNHFAIMFDPSGEEVQLDIVKKENTDLKRRLERLESAILDKL